MLNHGFSSVKAAAPRKFEIWDSGAATFSWSTRATIADAVARILLRPEQRANNYIYVSIFETNQLELLEALKRVTGSHDWDVNYANSEDKIKQGKWFVLLLSVVNLKPTSRSLGNWRTTF